MKKRKFFLLLIFMLTFFLQGCMKFQESKGENIISPNNTLVPIKGTWKIKEISYDSNNINKKIKGNFDPKSLLDKKAAFNYENAIVADEICKNPKYKIKKVNLKSYLINKFDNNAYSKFDIPNKDVDVISISSEDKFFHDFIRINENNIFAILNNVVFKLEKIDDNFSINLNNIEKHSKSINKKSSNNKELNTCLLLGIKSPNPKYQGRKDLNQSEKQYNTIFISSKNGKINAINKIENLLVPRKDGFWRVGIDRNGKKDFIYSYPTSKENNKNKIKEKKTNPNNSKKDSEVYREILFIGNDYICTENDRYYGDGFNRLNQLSVLPIDNVYNNIGIRISDIDNENGYKSFMSSVQRYLSSADKDDIKNLEEYPSDQNFFLGRRNGHWILQGRLNDIKEGKDYKDFPITMNVPKKMVNYDKLNVSWNSIKSKVPNAKDAYTSPNQELAIIISDIHIYIYSIKENQLSTKPIYQIDSKGEVIMAEWATGGYYTDKWSNVVSKIKNTSILKELRNKSEYEKNN